MGTDIHMGVEKHENGRWRRMLPPPELHADEDYSHLPEGSYLHEWKRKRNQYEWYGGRNYDLFGMLANVRNGVGFAGVKTGDGFTPIAMPRGLPDDLSLALKKRLDPPEDDESGDIWLGEHNHSWLLLRELIEYDWKGQVTGHYGWVDAEEYQSWKRNRKPTSWCTGVSGTSIRHATNKEMENCIKRGDTENVYTLVGWVETYADSAGSFYTKTLPALRQLGPPDKIRIVFGFDS
jgi:hypothetical protein